MIALAKNPAVAALLDRCDRLHSLQRRPPEDVLLAIVVLADCCAKAALSIAKENDLSRPRVANPFVLPTVRAAVENTGPVCTVTPSCLLKQWERGIAVDLTLGLSAETIATKRDKTISQVGRVIDKLATVHVRVAELQRELAGVPYAGLADAIEELIKARRKAR